MSQAKNYGSIQLTEEARALLRDFTDRSMVLHEGRVNQSEALIAGLRAACDAPDSWKSALAHLRATRTDGRSRRNKGST